MSTGFDKHGADQGGPDKDLPDEQQLDAYLRGGSDVSRQYRQLPSADVPAELDRLVLRQAQEAVKARPQKSRTWMRWTGPLALAASAVLVISIVIESGVQEDTYLTAPASAPAELPMQESAEQPIAASVAEKRASGAKVQAEAVAVNENDARVGAVEPVQTPMNLDAPPAIMAPKEPTLALDQTSSIQQTAPPPVAAPFVSPPASLSVEEATQALARRERANAIPQESERLAEPTPGVVVTDTRLRGIDMASHTAVVTAQRNSEQKQTAGPRNTVVAPAAADSTSSAAMEADEPRNYSDPEQWLRDIRELRKQKKHDAADLEWQRFRYVFPNYQVAEDDLARGVQR